MNTKHNWGKTIFIVTLSLLLCSVSFAKDWPNYRGPNYNGISRETGWKADWESEEKDFIVWHEEIGVGFSSFSVVDGRLYTLGNVDDRDILYCFEADSGRLIWKKNYSERQWSKNYEGGPNATPTVHQGKVYTFSKQGKAFCWDARDGSMLWEKNLQEVLGCKVPTWGFSGSVLIVDNLAIYNAGEKGVALNKETGEKVWQNGTSASGYATPVPYQKEGRSCIALFTADSVAGLEALTGRVLWEFPWKTSYDVNAADPIVWDDKVFITSGYNHGCALLSIADNQAKEIWSNRNIRSQMNSCVRWQGYIYGFDENTLTCIDVETGREMWDQGGLGKGSLMMADGRLIILSERGTLVVADASPKGFSKNSSLDVLNGKCWTVPVLSNGRIYARNARRDGTSDLVSVDLEESQPAADNPITKSGNWPQWRGPQRSGRSSETGLMKTWPAEGPKLLWSVTGLGKGFASPIVVDGTVYVPGLINDDGVMHAFDLQGNEKWKKVYAPEWRKSFPGARSTPTYVDGTLYIITGEGVVVCQNADNGEVVWSIDAKEKYKGKSGAWGYAECPLVFDDKVIFQTGGDEAGMVAFDRDTGEELWVLKGTGEQNAYCSPSLIEMNGRKIITTMMADSVWFVDGDTGKMIFREKFSEFHKTTRDLNCNTPIFHDGQVFFTSGYNCGSVAYTISDDGRTIKRKWAEEVLDTHHGNVVYADGNVYGSNWLNNSDGDWVSLDWSTGSPNYQHDWRSKGSILYADDRLYVYEEKEGYMGLVKPKSESFELVGSFPITMGTEQHWSHPVICDGRLYVRHGDAMMVFDIREN